MPITFSALEDMTDLLRIAQQRAAVRPSKAAKARVSRVSRAADDNDYPEVSGPAPTWIGN